MKRLFTLIFACVTTLLVAQDPHFSQYFAAPYQLNPAMNGVFNGRFRVTANYRDQWSSFLSGAAYRTAALGTDFRFNTVGDDYFAVGLSLMQDQAGTSSFTRQSGHLAASYIKQVSGGSRRNSASHFVVLGGQVGYGQNSIDWSRLWFSNQFDMNNQAPNTTLPSNEPGQNIGSTTFLDMNAGLLWYALYGEEGYIYAGAAMNHINTPDISFIGNKNQALYRRMSYHAGGLIPLNDVFGLAPGALVMTQGPAFQANIGANIRYTNHDRNELGLRAGAFARLSNKYESGILMDAIAIVGMVEYQRWQFGISYDINTSSLTAASNARGAFEISAQYWHPEVRRAKLRCPKL